jgi:hypothetical protein
MQNHYVQTDVDVGVHHFRPVAISKAINNCVVGYTQSQETKWKSVGKGYTFATWENVGRWLMIAYANKDYERLKKQQKEYTPTVIVSAKTQLIPSWTSVQGMFMPSKNITRIGIIYPTVESIVGYACSNVTIWQEFDMYSSE